MSDDAVPDTPPQWPWDRLLVFAFGCVAASIGVYVVIFHAFQSSFGIDEDIMPNAYAWGTFAIVLGLLLLSLPWFKAGPLARKWRRHQQ